MARQANAFRQHVAVVDDDCATRESFAVLLELHGYDVETFDGGAQFLARLPHLVADCVLLDVRMRPLDGLEVLKRLVATDPHPPVILMTAIPKLVSRVMASDLGATAILEKPIARDDLVSAIDTALTQTSAA